MKPTTALIALTLLALAACGSGDEVELENASVSEVAEQVRDAGLDDQWVRPGLWSTTVTLAEVDMPGMPAEVRDRMQSSMGRQNHETCLTAEQAQRPNEDFFAGADKSCRYDHFRMDDGKIDAKMRCQAGGMTQQMEMNGTYRRDSYDMTMVTRAEAEGSPMGPMTMRMKVESKRVGGCSEEQLRAAEAKNAK